MKIKRVLSRGEKKKKDRIFYKKKNSLPSVFPSTLFPARKRKRHESLLCISTEKEKNNEEEEFEVS